MPPYQKWVTHEHKIKMSAIQKKNEKTQGQCVYSVKMGKANGDVRLSIPEKFLQQLSSIFYYKAMSVQIQIQCR
jgi:hypothetical protein